jgi:tetratricopeptide (TPR) repeat protein
MKNFAKCVAECDDGLAKCKGENYDYLKTGKIMARKANALLQMQKYDESIEVYSAALLENNEHSIKMGL